MRWFVVGRTASGKDALRNRLEAELGWKFVKSCTTRSPRYPDEDTHTFVTWEEADSCSSKVARTFIRNTEGKMDEYYATKDEFESSDAYIIDPYGLYNLLRRDIASDANCGKFGLVYVQACSLSERVKNGIRRNSRLSKLKSFAQFACRNLYEGKAFSVFEDLLKFNVPLRNVEKRITVTNTYRDNFSLAISCISMLDEELRS